MQNSSNEQAGDAACVAGHRGSPGPAPSDAWGEHPIPREIAVREWGIINTRLFLSNLTCVKLLVGGSENILGKLLIWGLSAPKNQCLPMACEKVYSGIAAG